MAGKRSQRGCIGRFEIVVEALGEYVLGDLLSDTIYFARCRYTRARNGYLKAEILIHNISFQNKKGLARRPFYYRKKSNHFKTSNMRCPISAGLATT